MQLTDLSFVQLIAIVVLACTGRIALEKREPPQQSDQEEHNRRSSSNANDFFYENSNSTATYGSRNADSAILLPLGGNTWAQNVAGGSRFITSAGIENWTSSQVSFNTFFRVSKPGTLRIKLKAKTQGQSQLGISIKGIRKEVFVDGRQLKLLDAGTWQIKDTGYLMITLTGITKTADTFAEVSDYEISGTVVDTNVAFVKTNDGNFFYWGRRGPSVHLNYPFDDTLKAKWFYNELTVPKGNDVIGSFFMSIGFAEGYFGIQVNSATERRILFSVWSPFKTDDPKSIPESKRITVLKKGDGVYTGEFGNEGSGGQSYLRYSWVAGRTYRFLLHGAPDYYGNTIYTAYFFAPENNRWMLIASFKRPETNTYLRRFHSFLENFIPEHGDQERRVLFNNQWLVDENHKWIELNKAYFTYDNTAAKGYRKDYAGGIEKGRFF